MSNIIDRLASTHEQSNDHPFSVRVVNTKTGAVAYQEGKNSKEAAEDKAEELQNQFDADMYDIHIDDNTENNDGNYKRDH